jgi:hypothetical protein
MRQYDYTVDKAILEIFRNNEDTELSYGELKGRIETIYTKGRKIPSALFSSRLSQMVSNSRDLRYLVNPILKKRDYGRGRNVMYSLTDKAWRRLKLELSILMEDSTREKAYHILLRFASFQNVPADWAESQMLDEEQLEHFLFKIQVSKNELKQISVESGILSRQVFVSSKKLKRIDEPVKITRLSREHENDDIAIFRIDYLSGSEKEGEFYYTYQLPGISADEAFNYDQSGIFFSDIELTRNEIIECLQLLEKEGLVKRLSSSILQYLDEVRYDIADEQLRKYLVKCSILHGMSTMRMHLAWQYRPPKHDEELWYSILWGNAMKEARTLEFRKRREKTKHIDPIQQKKIRHGQERSIKSYDRGAKKAFDELRENYPSITTNCSYLTDVLIEWVYPTFLRGLNQNGTI